MKIIRIAIRLVQALAFLVFFSFMVLLETTGNLLNMGVAAIAFLIAIIIERHYLEKGRVKKQQESVCIP